MKGVAKHEHATLQVLLGAEVSVEMLIVLHLNNFLSIAQEQ